MKDANLSTLTLSPQPPMSATGRLSPDRFAAVTTEYEHLFIQRTGNVWDSDGWLAPATRALFRSSDRGGIGIDCGNQVGHLDKVGALREMLNRRSALETRST